MSNGRDLVGRCLGNRSLKFFCPMVHFNESDEFLNDLVHWRSFYGSTVVRPGFLPIFTIRNVVAPIKRSQYEASLSVWRCVGHKVL